MKGSGLGMKKNQVACLYMICLCFATIISLYIPKTEGVRASEEAVVIPEEAIRLRILANSDSEEDQEIKRQIRDEVNANITNWVAELTSLEAARQVLKSKLPDVQQIAQKYVEERGLQQEVKVEFGKASFPTKLYGQYLYPAGEYEAIVITLGEGSGANWWCVLFPPLCFLDFSNGTAVSMTPVVEAAEQTDQTDQDQTVTPEGTEETEEKEQVNQTNASELDEQLEIDQEVQTEEAVATTPVYVHQDEEQQVIETRWFFVDFFKELF